MSLLDSRLCDLLGIDKPIVLAPMVVYADGALAAAVSEAGGLGTFGAWSLRHVNEKFVREQLANIRRHTTRPFGVGFATHHIPACRETFDAVLEAQVPTILFSFDDPTPWIPLVHSSGAKALCQVQSFVAAQQAVDAGADVLCVQGNEAGGHTGTANLLPLLRQVTEAFPQVPTLAAGGITDGASLAGVIAAGADGAWLGTAFLAAREASYQQPALAEAIIESDGTDTIFSFAPDVVLGAMSGGPEWPTGIGLRLRGNEITNEWHGREAELGDDKDAVAAYVRRFTEGDERVLPYLYGQGAGAISSVRSAREIMDTLLVDAEQRLLEIG